MAADERDRNFDKALARHLRSAARSGETAKAQPGFDAPRGACPDAEMLAGYHDRSLLPDEMDSWKVHIAGCAYCREMLAQLEATEETASNASSEKVLATEQPEPLVTSPKIEAASSAPSATQSKPDARAVLPAKAREARLAGGPGWHWLAPAGALAAGLLVWIAMHENQPMRFRSPAEEKVVMKQPPGAPASSVSATPQAATSSPQSHDTLAKRQSAAGEIASTNGQTVSEAAKTSSKLDYETPVSPAKPLSDKEKGARKDAGRDSFEDAFRAENKNQMDLDAKTVTGAVQQKLEVQSQVQAPAQAPNVQSQNQYNYNASKVSGPGPLGKADATKKMKEAPLPAPAAGTVGGTVAELNGSASTALMMTVFDARLISAPGSKVIWRTGRAGLIEFSSDGGASWSRQTSGVLVDLSTGSAPSDKVCWIVGRVGAVLLTTDGGAHWKLLATPVKEDLGGVHATDALHATIWNVQNRRSFETSDGGVTWKRVANE